MQPETCVGVDEVNRWLAEWVEGFDNWSLDIEEVVDAGHQVVSFIRQRANPRHGGPEIEMRMAQVWTFRDGRIARMEMYADRAEALEAAGLSEQAMSGQNVELVRHAVQAFNQRDLAALTQSFTPDVEWEPGGPAAVERALYRGRDDVSSGFAATWETWEVFHVEESEVRVLGDSVVWLGRARLRGEASHVDFDQPFAIHFLVRGGKIVRLRGFLSWQEALEAAELSG
jgi:ketosteroid isomerase-like protein